MTNLAHVALDYRTRANRHRYDSQEWRDAQAMADALERMIANRTPNDHHATWSTSTHLTAEWARRHGYQIAVTGYGGPAGFILQRGDHLVVANIPARLHWNGNKITLEQP